MKKKGDLEGMFKGMGSAIGANLRRKGLEDAHRVTAADVGRPIEHGDARVSRGTFLVREAVKIVLSNGQPSELLDAYKLPEYSDLIRRGQKEGELNFNIEKINELKRVLAFTQVESGDFILDYRGKEVGFSVSSSQRVLLQSDGIDSSGRSFHPTQMLLGLLSAVEAQSHNEYVMVPYPHLENKDGTTRVVSKTLILLNKEKLDELKRLCTQLVLKTV